MIIIFKNKHISKSKTIYSFSKYKLKKYILGTYNSKYKIFSYKYQYLSKYLKLGVKISKSMIHLILKNLNNNGEMAELV